VPGPLHQTDAHVLAKGAHTGDHTVLTCFSPGDGLFTALLRASRGPKTDTAPTPDLFDRLALVLEHGKGSSGGPWFVREHRLLVRHASIGRDYEPLAAASRLARVVTQNPVPEDSRAAIDALLAQAFAAFARPASRPDLVYFKSLYLLARDEGLPLKQEWLPSLPAADRTLVGSALNFPSDSPDAPRAADLVRLTKRLETYLVGEHELRIG
jgi:hypothetical protein